MSKPSLASKITDALKRAFGKSTRPVVSSKAEDLAAGGAGVKDDSANESIPADTAVPQAAAEFATEAASTQEQQPTESPETAEATEVAEEPAQGEPDLVAPEEKAEIAEDLKVAEAETVAATTEAFTEALAAEAADDATAELPVPNYDTLTLPSVRARLRKLTIEQVRQLRAYESANANRDQFVRMYDNRIAKLESETAE